MQMCEDGTAFLVGQRAECHQTADCCNCRPTSMHARLGSCRHPNSSIRAWIRAPSPPNRALVIGMICCDRESALPHLQKGALQQQRTLQGLLVLLALGLASAAVCPATVRYDVSLGQLSTGTGGGAVQVPSFVGTVSVFSNKVSLLCSPILWVLGFGWRI